MNGSWGATMCHYCNAPEIEVQQPGPAGRPKRRRMSIPSKVQSWLYDCRLNVGFDDRKVKGNIRSWIHSYLLIYIMVYILIVNICACFHLLFFVLLSKCQADIFQIRKLTRTKDVRKNKHILSVQETEQAEQSGHLSLLTAPKHAKTRMIEMILEQMWNKISNNFLANMTYSANTGNEESWLKWSRYFHRICWNFLPSAKVNDCWKPMDSVRRLGNIVKATILVKESRFMTMVYFASHHSSKEYFVAFCFWGCFLICVDLTGGGSLVPLVLDRLCSPRLE